jgi:asparagine synthase (glutamine-hydrolysing)
MSGIVGIWNLDEKPVEREVLARMSGTMAHRGLDGEEMLIKGPVGLACQLSRVTPESEKETQPLVNSSGTVLVFDGRLDNREELLADLKQSHHVSSSSPDAALVLASYEVFRDKFPERLLGDFALGLFDPNRQRLLLALLLPNQGHVPFCLRDQGNPCSSPSVLSAQRRPSRQVPSARTRVSPGDDVF